MAEHGDIQGREECRGQREGVQKRGKKNDGVNGKIGSDLSLPGARYLGVPGVPAGLAIPWVLRHSLGRKRKKMSRRNL